MATIDNSGTGNDGMTNETIGQLQTRIAELEAELRELTERLDHPDGVRFWKEKYAESREWLLKLQPEHQAYAITLADKLAAEAERDAALDLLRDLLNREQWIETQEELAENNWLDEDALDELERERDKRYEAMTTARAFLSTRTPREDTT